ncbi:MAG: ATP synthase subunit I [Maricaulaceae bacterium]
MSLTASLIVGYVAGLGCGVAYFGALWRSVEALARRDKSIGRFATTSALRIIVALAVVLAAARAGVGGAALVAALVGFLTVRSAATLTARRAALARGGE